MEKIIQKVNGPYNWDINGEDYYWIINETTLDSKVHELGAKKDVSNKTATNED